MSQTIDHRIVEMRFDNKQFETGAKQTMGTLARLKEALKLPDSTKALEGIDEATKNISLDGIAAGVDALNARFSTMGIVGMRVIQNITDGLMNKLNAAVNFVSDSIISGGIKRAMNIENAHFQLQALLKDETKVQAVMADAMESVDGTAYAYDEAAKAAAQFSASGIQAGEEMLGALKGITGVAAMTNSQFADISMIFTTVAGNGRLMGDQLLQLSSRGLNAASTLADYFKEVKGQSKMTEGTIRDMVSKGKISFKDFSDAMTWAFGDSAKRANETFTGAMSNMKSALARIGAGFISPLVEQNGELVNLFNALRIKINDVKTALVFDEQSSAISGLTKQSELLDETMSKAIQNGTIGMDKFIESIFKANDSEDKFGKKTEKMTEILTELNKSGTLTSDMLDSINQYGGRATNALRSYISGVKDGTIKASDSMKKMVEEMTGDITVLNSDVTRLVKDGKINADLFTAAMTHSTRTVLEESGGLSDALKNMFAEVKKEGHVTQEALDNMSENGIDAGKAIVEYMQGVKNGTIRASYATRSAIEGMSEDVIINAKSVKKMVEDGAITFDIFQSAMEHAFGDESKKLSKQFTDSFLDALHKVVDAVNEFDVTNMMDMFYYGVESIKNLAKGLYSVLRPIGVAFADVFLDFNGDDVINFAAAIEELTAKMQLSEKGSKNLHDAFEGVFSIVKLLVDIFFALFGAIVPINKPVLEMGGGFLGLAGSLGRALTWMTKMIRSCTLLKRGFELVKNGINLSMSVFSSLIRQFKDFGGTVLKLEGTQKLIGSIAGAFDKLGSKAESYMDGFIDNVETLFQDLFHFRRLDTDSILKAISQAFADLSWEIDHFSLKKITDGFDKFRKKLKEIKDKITDLAMSNKGFAAFVKNIEKYVDRLKDAFGKDSVSDKIDSVKEGFEKFIDWIRERVLPMFDDFTIGGAAAVGVGVAIVVGLLKISGAFKKVSKALGGLTSKVGSTLDAVKGTLFAYQKDLKADAILKIAKAIAVLAVALLLLSFADANGLLAAGMALAAAGGALSYGIGKLIEAISKWNSQDKALTIFAKGVKGFLNKLGMAREIKAVGASLKNFGKAILMIGGTMIAIALMYRKDPKALREAGNYVVEISTMLVVLQLISNIMGKAFGNNEGFKNAGKGVAALAASLFIVVAAMDKLFKMGIPSNYQFKLDILAQALLGVAALALVLGIASRIAGGGSVSGMKGVLIEGLGKEGKSFAASSNGGSLSAAPILALAASLHIVIGALNKVFNMGIPSDYELKLKIMAGMMIGLGGLMIAMGYAGKLAGGAIKAALSILALSGFLVVTVGALFVLTLIPGDKLLNGAKALGRVLVALAVALAGAGKVIKPEAAKVVFNMAIMVGVITAALAVLSIVPLPKLLKAAGVLDSVLLSLAFTFKNAAKSGKGDWQVVAFMVAETVAIAISLYKLSEQPWGGLLSAAIAMDAVMIGLIKMLEMISSRTGLKPEKMNQVLKSMIVVGVIAASLYFLADKDWGSLIAGALSLSVVMLALSGVLKIISGTKVEVGTIVGFVACAIALIPIAAALNMIAGIQWSEVGPAIVALGGTAAILVAALMVMSLAGPGILPGIVAFVAGAIALIPIAMVMNMLSGLTWEQVATGLITLAGALAIIGVAGLAGIAIAPGLLLLSIALIAFGAAIAVVGAGLLVFVGSLVTSVGLLSELFKMIGSALPEFAEAGKNVMLGFIKGIVEGFKGVVATVKKVMGGVVDTVKNVLGIHSPSVILEMLGINTDEGFALGITKGSGTIDESLNGVFGKVGSKVKEKLGGMFGFGEEAGETFSSGITEGANTTELADTMATEFSAMGHDPRYYNTGSEASGNFLTGFDDGSLGIDAVMGEVMSSFGGSLDMNQFYGMGDLSAESLMSGFTGGFDPTRLTNPINESLGAMANDPRYYNSGQGVGTSFTDGVTDSVDYSQFYNMGNDSSAQFLQGFQTGSNESIGEVANEVANTLKTSLANQDLATPGTEAMNKFVLACTTALQNSVGKFTTVGMLSASAWIAAVVLKYPEASSTGTTFALRVLSALQEKIPEFLRKGLTSATQYLTGIKNKYPEAITTGSTLAEKVLEGIRSREKEFYKVGENAGKGFVDGMRSKIEEAAKAAAELAKAALDAAKKALDEHSPSKEMGKIGDNAGLGFINKLMLYVAKAKKIGEEIGESAIEGTSEGMRTSIDFVLTDFDPIIRPTVDLRNVEESAQNVRNMFNSAVANIRDNVEDVSISVAKSKRSNNVIDERDEKQKRREGITNYNFVQNNNSPKALSRIEIYRQTKNQFSQFKEATSTT